MLQILIDNISCTNHIPADCYESQLTSCFHFMTSICLFAPFDGKFWLHQLLFVRQHNIDSLFWQSRRKINNKHPAVLLLLWWWRRTKTRWIKTIRMVSIQTNEEILSLPWLLYKCLFQSHGEQYWEQQLLCCDVTSNTFFPTYGEQCNSAASNDCDTDDIDDYHYWQLKFATMILSKLALTTTSTLSFYEEDCVVDHTSPIKNRKTNTNCQHQFLQTSTMKVIIKSLIDEGTNGGFRRKDLIILRVQTFCSYIPYKRNLGIWNNYADYGR